MLDKLYLALRMGMSPGLFAAQACHLGMEFAFEHPETAQLWRRSSNTIVIVEALNEHQLRSLQRRALDRGLKTSAFHDEDLVPSLTGVVIEPSHEAKSLCRGLPLAFRHAV